MCVHDKALYKSTFTVPYLSTAHPHRELEFIPMPVAVARCCVAGARQEATKDA